MSNTQGIQDDKLRELVRVAEAAGFTTERSGSAHVKFFTPQGRYVTSCTTTKTCGKSYYEVRSKLRRAGLVC